MMKLAVAIAAVLLTHPLAVAAVFRPRKFAAWFPLKSADTFSSVSNNTCNATLRVYNEAFDQHVVKAELMATCAAQQRCILENLGAEISARLASASVLLGLTPGILASLGPSIAEISLLSTERPVLSLLLSFGSPAVFPSRVLQYQNALDIVPTSSTAATAVSPLATQRVLMALRRSRRLRALVSAAQYITAAVATTNVMYTSFELGVRTTISFRCSTSMLPLIWTLLPFGVHLPAALALNIAKWRQRKRDRKEIERAAGAAAEGRQRSTIARWHAAFRKETDVCAMHAPLDAESEAVAMSLWAIAFNYLATFLSNLHVTFGILIFSSVVFIDVIDVVTVILRYMVSSVICRAVLGFELASLSKASEKNDGDASHGNISNGDDPQDSKQLPRSVTVPLLNKSTKKSPEFRITVSETLP
ncbi:MAG: hypothetical protein STHCBS139747_003941 [Sporothrix thermara]